MQPRGPRVSCSKSVVVTQHYCIEGGFLKQPAPIETRTVDGHLWVRCLKHEPWWCKAVACESNGRSPLKRSRFFDLLYDRAMLAMEGKDSNKTMDDPMMQLESEPVPALAGGKHKGGGAKRSKDKDFLHTVSIEVPENFYDSTQRTISVMLWGPVRARKLQTWIRVEDLDWAIRYVHAELVHHGVPVHKESPAKDKSGLRWDSAKSAFVYYWLDEKAHMQQVLQTVPRLNRKTNMPLEPDAYRAMKKDARGALKKKVLDLGHDTTSFGAWESEAEDIDIGETTSDSQPPDVI